MPAGVIARGQTARTMSETILIWMVPAAIALHNLEEALWLPAWSESRAGRWHRAVGVFEFRMNAVELFAGRLMPESCTSNLAKVRKNNQVISIHPAARIVIRYDFTNNRESDSLTPLLGVSPRD
jgi:hypothetical protein